MGFLRCFKRAFPPPGPARIRAPTLGRSHKGGGTTQVPPKFWGPRRKTQNFGVQGEKFRAWDPFWDEKPKILGSQDKNPNLGSTQKPPGPLRTPNFFSRGGSQGPPKKPNPKFFFSSISQPPKNQTRPRPPRNGSNFGPSPRGLPKVSETLPKTPKFWVKKNPKIPPKNSHSWGQLPGSSRARIFREAAENLGKGKFGNPENGDADGKIQRALLRWAELAERGGGALQVGVAYLNQGRCFPANGGWFDEWAWLI